MSIALVYSDLKGKLFNLVELFKAKLQSFLSNNEWGHLANMATRWCIYRT